MGTLLVVGDMVLWDTQTLRSICKIQSSRYGYVRIIGIVALIKHIFSIPSSLKIHHLAIPEDLLLILLLRIICIDKAQWPTLFPVIDDLLGIAWVAVRGLEDGGRYFLSHFVLFEFTLQLVDFLHFFLKKGLECIANYPPLQSLLFDSLHHKLFIQILILVYKYQLSLGYHRPLYHL